MVNTADMKRLIIKIASEEGVDPAIALAIAEQESGFNPNARNKTNREDSLGMFQINTKAHPDYKGGFNPEANARYGIRMLKNLLNKTNGNVQQAMAAYNGGWGGKNSKQAQAYARQAFGRTGKYASVSKNADKIATNYNDAVSTNGAVTGGASGFDVEKPTAPKFQGLNTTVDDPTGQSKAKITPREEMALRNIAAPVQAPRDIRPNVVVGTNEDGTPQVVTASQYNEMLNQLDTERIMQANQELQANLPAMAKAEIQLGGQNAYDTMLGLRNEYNNMIANDPRMALTRLTPEQARKAASEIRNEYMWGGNHGKLSRAQMYQMLNALENYQTPYDDLYALTGEGYKKQLDNMKAFQESALTLADGNLNLAKELMKQAQAGNQDVVNAIKGVQEKRMELEANHQKQMQSGYDTMNNTRLQGLNTYYNSLPQAELDLLKVKNQFNQGVYGTQGSMYGTDVGANVEMIKPQIQADVDARNPVTREKLDIERAKVDVGRQNANTAEAVAGANIVANSAMNSQGFNAASAGVPSINRVMGNPNAGMREQLFGFGRPTNNPVTLTTLTDLLRGD